MKKTKINNNNISNIINNNHENINNIISDIIKNETFVFMLKQVHFNFLHLIFQLVKSPKG